LTLFIFFNIIEAEKWEGENGKDFYAKNQNREGIEANSIGGASVDDQSCLQEFRFLSKAIR
jgi:hypothetical protein